MIKEETIFDIKVSPESFPLILRFARLVKWGVLLSAISHIIFLIGYIRSYINFNYSFFNKRPLIILRHEVGLVYTFIHLIILIILLIVYWKLGTTMNKSIIDKDEIKFNTSFKLLYRYQVLALLTIVLTLMIDIFDLVFDFL